jgi:DNA-directed RNA polymerase subunit RPC12/RpoP
MRRLLGLVALGLTLSIGGNVMADQVADEHVKAKNLIKCSTCGAEFTSAAGVEDHVRTHPEHKAALPKGTLIKCSTCGVEFTEHAGVVEVSNAGPGKAESVSGKETILIKCSTCKSIEH